MLHCLKRLEHLKVGNCPCTLSLEQGTHCYGQIGMNAVFSHMPVALVGVCQMVVCAWAARNHNRAHN